MLQMPFRIACFIPRINPVYSASLFVDDDPTKQLSAHISVRLFLQTSYNTAPAPASPGFPLLHPSKYNRCTDWFVTLGIGISDGSILALAVAEKKTTVTRLFHDYMDWHEMFMWVYPYIFRRSIVVILRPMTRSNSCSPDAMILSSSSIYSCG